MSWLDRLLGPAPVGPAPVGPVPAEAQPAVATDPPPAPSPAQKRDAAGHVARFERAIEQCEEQIEHGEASADYLAQLGRWRDYYAGLALLEQGRPDAPGPLGDGGEA